MNIKECVEKHTTGGKVVFFFAITQAVYGTMLIFSIPKVMQYSNGLKIFDLLPAGYNQEYAKTLLETLGETGRAAYLWRQIPLDMLYPGLFAVAYSLLLVYLFKKLSVGPVFSSASMVPIFVGLFDYLENIGIISMLVLYPTFKPWVTTLTSIFSIAKSTATTIVFLLLIGTAIALGIRWLRDETISS